MKTIYYTIVMTLLFTATTLNAQVSETTIPIKEDIVPKAIKNALDLEFPNYKVTQYTGIPRKYEGDEFVEESDGGIEDEFKAITVNLKGVDNDLLATYDLEGKLKTVFSSKPNKDIPAGTIDKVHQAYPDWTVINYYRHLFGDTITVYVVIKKGDQTITLFTDEFGDFVKI